MKIVLKLLAVGCWAMGSGMCFRLQTHSIRISTGPIGPIGPHLYGHTLYFTPAALCREEWQWSANCNLVTYIHHYGVSLWGALDKLLINPKVVFCKMWLIPTKLKLGRWNIHDGCTSKYQSKHYAVTKVMWCWANVYKEEEKPTKQMIYPTVLADAHLPLVHCVFQIINFRLHHTHCHWTQFREWLTKTYDAVLWGQEDSGFLPHMPEWRTFSESHNVEGNLQDDGGGNENQ